MIEYKLYSGRKFTGIAVRPDPEWPKLWRVHRGEKVSDVVNLTRAKDAARSWAMPKEGGIGHLLKWKVFGTPTEARQAR